MNNIVIRCIHENDKRIFVGFMLTTLNIYILSKVLKDHEHRISELEKENNVDKSKGE